ncbi:cytochrome b/b6 domain-containing protein [uncultured Roseobacter sp.]|uniref:cytochrome b/b6 domain-containing protein n=1 Tax=uncultured Roseobacter sp. TaxID=114847 RepID=UPI002625EA00|nr:cytochrome b/b6 domain-containing protein [uncultured Roseobacter sp.]
MSLSNTATHYGAVTKTFHWLTALLILTLIPLGIYANGLPFDTSEQLAQKARLFSLHKTLGVTVFFVALARILWALSQPKPGLLHADRKIESLAAETVHWLLYGSLLLVPMSGWVHHAATDGFAPIWWPLGQNLPFVPKSESLAATAAGLHIVFERVLVASIFLHFAGALKHHIIDKDATLRRMLPGTPAVADTGGGHRVAAPLISALVIWAGALFVGSTLDIYAKHDAVAPVAALEDVQSDWTVQDGELSITVQQLGSDVRGSFADWTAAISFDETVTTGTAGKVDVTISIGSLTLGSVTSQALGADFFNAENFPTAQFTADIINTEAGYQADGTLTIKDKSMPVTLPFTLEVAEGIATMTGSTQLDRRNYAIGDNQKDEATLGFTVAVDVSLTAQQSQ